MNNTFLESLIIVAVLLVGALIPIQVSGQVDGQANEQEGPPREVAQLRRQFRQLYAAGRFQEAIVLAERVLVISEKALGPEDPIVARSLGELGVINREAGAYAPARAYFERALGITEKLFGPEHSETALALNNVASVFSAIGAFRDAEPLLQRALAIHEKTAGPEHISTATSLDLLAAVYRNTAAYSKAEQLLQRALAINEKVFGPEHRTTAVSLNNLAEVYRLTGAYSRAVQLQQRALGIRERVLGPQHPVTAESLNNLATLYIHTGEYAKSEQLYARALQIMEKLLGPEHPSTSTALSNLAALYTATGGHAQAAQLLERALAIQEKRLGPEHPLTTVSLNNLAAAYDRLGAHEKVKPLYRRVLENYEKTLGPEHPNTATALNNLGSQHRYLEDFAVAEQLLQRARSTSEKIFGPTHMETGRASSNLAAVYLATRDYAQAEPLLRRAVAIYEATLGPTHPETAVVLENLGQLYSSKREHTQAEQLLQRALQIHEENTIRFLLAGSESRQLSYVQLAAHRVDGLAVIALNSRSPGQAALGLTSVLQYKGRVLDTMSDSVARLRRSAAAEDRILLDQLSVVAQQFSSLTYGGLSKPAAAGRRERLDELAARQGQLQAQLSSRSALFRQTVAPITLEAVRRALPSDAILVEWIRLGTARPRSALASKRNVPRYLAYVLQSGGDPVVIDVGEAIPLEALMRKFRNALMDPASESRGASRAPSARPDLRALTAELSERLIRPLRAHLSKGRRLLLSPDGALNLIPFAALLDEDGEYLAQNHEISYLTSGRDLLRLGSDPPARSGAVVLAAPSYGSGNGNASLQAARVADLGRRGLVFQPLPGAAVEAQILQSLLSLDSQRMLTGDRATEAQLRALQGPQILHLATHGFFLGDADLPTAAASFSPGTSPAPALGENPLLRSGLALAGANTRRSGDTDDGILTAAEVAQLDLLGTQLVVLSACETALGTVDTGEGVYGLRRALVLAGAQSQMVSLWKVDDTATRELMVDYYQRLLRGEGRAAALRAAQQAMLADPARQHPYYWAAFISIGNWTPLKDPTSP